MFIYIKHGGDGVSFFLLSHIGKAPGVGASAGSLFTSNTNNRHLIQIQ